MIHKPWKIGLKVAVCAFFLFFTILFLVFSVGELREELQYSSVEAKLGRMEALYASGDYDRIRNELRYCLNNYRDEFDAMWEIAEAYDALSAYESYIYASARAESNKAEYYEAKAKELQLYLETVCRNATYPQNQRAYQYFMKRMSQNQSDTLEE